MSKPPILSLLWALATGSVLTAGCGEGAAVTAESVSPPLRDAPDLYAARSASPPQQSPTVAPGPTLPPQAILQSAVKTLESRRSVAAKIRFEGNLFGKHLVGWGNYLEWQRSPNRLTRLELRSQVGSHTSSLVEVCDGAYLWRCRKLSGRVKLSRIDVEQANRGLGKATATTRQGGMGMLPGLGGLPRLLRGLDANFEFATAEAGRWGTLPVWRIRGRWRPDAIAQILPGQKEAIEKGQAPDLSKLPKHLPDEVVLLLGMEPHDRFLYRIEYRRTIPEAVANAAAEPGKTLTTMQLYDVVLDGPIDTDRFTYQPPDDLEFTDETQRFLESLGVAD